MQEITRRGVIDIGLGGMVSFQQSNEKVECFVYDISSRYTEISIAMYESRPCAGEIVELSIFLPTERTPIKFTGNIKLYPENAQEQDNQLAQVLITYISRMDLRRFELFTAQKRAFISGSDRQSFAV